MIKFIIHITRAIIAATVAMLFASCNLAQTLSGSGTVTTQERTIEGPFTGISASGNIEVYIEQGSAIKVIVDADDNLQKHIITERNGDELLIKTDINIGTAAAKRITVILPVITKVEAAAAALVKSKTILKAGSIEVACNSGSTAELTLLAQQLNCSASSGSLLKLTGNTLNLKIDSSSGGLANAKGLKATTVTAEASSGGNVTVDALQSLTANASSGGIINYINMPVSLSKRSSSGGKVNKE